MYQNLSMTCIRDASHCQVETNIGALPDCAYLVDLKKKNVPSSIIITWHVQSVNYQLAGTKKTKDSFCHLLGIK